MEKMWNFEPLKKISPDCKHAFSEEYQKLMLEPINGITDLPVTIEDHPSLPLIRGEEIGKEDTGN